MAQQLFLLRRSFEIQMFDLTAGQIQALNRLGLEYPELRPFIYDGDLPASAEERSAAHAFAEPWLDFFDTELLRRRTFPEATANLPDFVPWVMDTFRSSPVLNERLAESEGWYSNELRGLCERARVVDASENRKAIWLGRTVGDATLLERHGLTLKRERLVPIFVRPGDRLVEWPVNGDAPVGFRVVEVGEELRDGELPVSVIKEKTALMTRGFLPGPEWRVIR